jgi:hypothetical protein
MVAKQRGVLQNMAAMPPQSFSMTQESEYKGIRLKPLRQHSRQALRLERRSAG